MAQISIEQDRTKQDGAGWHKIVYNSLKEGRIKPKGTRQDRTGHNRMEQDQK